ncbi:hypothetical protein GWI33_017773 [Rhynchophorus ferrugineus]|uniref:Uncharacterized protein n=1 Tax=Rhynchophorus ferrugineus TaxID=354439 RepID=A0A834M3E7_RHYFE|nr:hypothetical protein GWI33_017773 [Rhynchophorus ferrugineus]
MISWPTRLKSPRQLEGRPDSHSATLSLYVRFHLQTDSGIDMCLRSVGHNGNIVFNKGYLIRLFQKPWKRRA